MNNPFFVLQSTDDKDVLGVIRNKYKQKDAYGKLYDSVVKCLQGHFDATVQGIEIPEDYLEHHKPITVKVKIGEIGHPFDDEFTLTMAWEY